MSERKSASYCKWCKTDNPPEANCCANCGALLPWPRKQYFAFIASFTLFFGEMLPIIVMAYLGVPPQTRLLFAFLFSILGFVLGAYAVITLGKLPEVATIGRGGIVVIMGVLFTILSIYFAITNWPVKP